MDKGKRRITIEMTEPTRKNYLTALSILGDCPNWTHFACGVLRSEVSGRDEPGLTAGNWYANSRAGREGLQTHQVSSADDARKKAIGSMRAWVVRNIQDEASKAKAESMEPGPAEQRALDLMRALGHGGLVRYRGGAWARMGLPVEGPGELPVLGPGIDAATGITVLRKLALKGLVKLDEVKGEAILN